MPIPEGLSPSSVPSAEQLQEMTEADIAAIIDRIAQRGNVVLGVSFWIDELANRRAQRVLADIASATTANAQQVSALAEVTKTGAAQNAEMVAMTRAIKRMTAVVALLTVANVVIAGIR